ncbi:hypothetical protein [Amylibacter sp. IMCC11727]|nr:hypothetical protein [Amylibacter sp. IMCC11727]WGI22564.1 hypothetical protein QBD29_03845 [Amylibacter sp. IMCC11727]
MIGWLLRFVAKVIFFVTVKLAIIFWPITLVAVGYVYLVYLN